MISTIAGLPAHPMFVHGAVVLIPLTALLTILWAFVPRFRIPLRWPVAIGSAVSAIVLLLTRESGDALAAGKDVGMHETYADWFTWATVAMIVLIFLMVVAVKRGWWAGAGGWAVRAIATVAAVAVLVTSVFVGHSGAQMVWKGETAGSEQSTSAPAGDGDGDAS